MPTRRLRFVWLLFSSLLSACASQLEPTAPQPQRWFADHLFSSPSRAVDDDVFAPSEAMRAFVNTTIKPAASLRNPRDALLSAITKDAKLKLAYDTASTRNAAEAFDARAGNCLSLVILTGALADLLGVPVQFNSVLISESWTRSANVYFASGHVNLTLTRGGFADRLGYDTAASMTVDFLPPEELRGMRIRPISRDTVVAMYLNNRAAEALANQQLDDAYWWARRAIERAPQALIAYNTLAVVYQRRGAFDEAESLLRYAHAVEPANTKILFNLAQLLDLTDRATEARSLRVRLAELESYPPFHFFDLGMAAMEHGDFATAKEHFAQELARASEHHEFHFGMAVATYRLGEMDKSLLHMRRAIALSSTSAQRDLYAAKAQLMQKQARKVQ